MRPTRSAIAFVALDQLVREAVRVSHRGAVAGLYLITIVPMAVHSTDLPIRLLLLEERQCVVVEILEANIVIPVRKLVSEFNSFSSPLAGPAAEMPATC